jgi:hypothetical protein
MTIYIFGNPTETAKCLDDYSLNKMIKDVAQVLCGVHHLFVCNAKDLKKIPLPLTNKNHTNGKNGKWIEWGECKANYLYLVLLGDQLIKEFHFRYRFSLDKYTQAIYWARDNVPNLPKGDEIHGITSTWGQPCDYHVPIITPFPLTMPKKYIYFWDDPFNDVEYHIIKSYRNYYKARLENLVNHTWTRRMPPEWLNFKTKKGKRKCNVKS